LASDFWPVAPLDPRLGLKAAILRETIDGANPGGWLPDERITMEASLRAYTANGAFAGFQEDRLGQLKPGYLADFVVFGENLLTTDPAGLADVPVLGTVVDGVPRYGMQL
jgi:predicted amidohydrolase YtcJ